MEDYSKRFNTNDPLRVGQCKNDICFTPSYSDLKHHNQKNNCWVGINGKIYDITKYKNALKTELNKKVKLMKMEYDNEKNIILTNNSAYRCTIDDNLNSDKMCQLKDPNNNHYLTDEEVQNKCNNNNQVNKQTTNDLKSNCNDLKSKYGFLKYNELGLICGKHYDNVNEKNIFFDDVNYNDFVIGEIKYYKLYKLLNIFINILVLCAIFYIIKYKINNNFIVTYVLIPLVLYVVYLVYKYIEIYFDRHIKYTKIKNEINKTKQTTILNNKISIEKTKDVATEIQQRLIGKLLLLILIVAVIIYGKFSNVTTINVLLAIIFIIFIYFFYTAIKRKLYEDVEYRFGAPTS